MYIQDISRSYGPYYYMADSYNQADNTYQLTALNPTGGYENVEAGTPYKDYRQPLMWSCRLVITVVLAYME